MKGLSAVILFPIFASAFEKSIRTFAKVVWGENMVNVREVLHFL